MKILVFGSRNWVRDDIIRRVLSKLAKLDHITLVHGGARGADRAAGRIGKELGFEVREYPADWDRHGRAAGPIRNAEMLEKENPDLDGVIIDKAYGFATGAKSRGSKDMAGRLWDAGVRYEILFP